MMSEAVIATVVDRIGGPQPSRVVLCRHAAAGCSLIE